ncbi:MAG TPA: hypothetical protein VMY88_12000 [Acidimicrobiales bacterium]|nr:hypothetical protein [Acidimicrobiales bacterium]
MPVARRRYDITPAEMLDLARTAVDAVVAELQSRTQELLPDQLSRLEQVSASLAKTVTEVAESSYRSQMESVRLGLDAVRDDITGAMAEHDARLVQAVENRLAGYDPAELSRRLPPAVASAVIDGLENALPTIDKGLHEVRELVGELVERGKRSELSRQNSLDRLDEVLVELRAGLSENVARQHSVLLEMIDEKLSALRLNEMASELPGRIGTVISDSVQRSHDVQAEAMQDLASGLGRSLDAGLNRQRSATAELSATAERMAASVSGFSEVAEEAVTVAFERAQAAQAQRLNTMMRELREAQDEAAAELKAALDGAVNEMRTFQVEQAGTLAAGLDERLGARVETVLEPQLQASSALRGSIEELVQDLHAARQEDAAALAGDLNRLGQEFERTLEPQLQVSRELRDAFDEAAERISAQVHMAIEPQAQAAIELRDAFDVVARELRAGQQEGALALTAELEQRLGERMESIVLPHQEALAETTHHLTEVVAGQAEGVVARLDSVAEELERVRSSTDAQRRSQESVLSAATENLDRLTGQIEVQTSTHEAALASHAEVMAAALDANATAVGDALESRSTALTEAFESRSAELAETIESSSTTLSRSVESSSKALEGTLESTSRQLVETVDLASKELVEAVDLTSKKLVETVGQTSKELVETLDSTSEALTGAVEAQSRSLGDSLKSQASAHSDALLSTRDQLTSHLSELMETVPPRISAELGAVLEESRTRHERVETLIAELAWIVGEQRAGATGIREDLALALEALPEAIASIQEASLRSEARITDLLTRKLQGPDAR